MPRIRLSTATEPMYATVGTAVPTDDEWTFEPKFDGMRVLAHADARAVKLVTRNGKEKQAQFPELVEALRRLQQRIGQRLVLDGEVVALRRGAAGAFQQLQQRMHVQDRDRISTLAAAQPTALYVFDLLQLGSDPLLSLPWSARRAALVRLMDDEPQRGALRVADSTPDARRMLARAQRGGWEGVIAKRTSAPYIPGSRSRDWLKLKLQYRAEFVVGGFTEPRNTREHLGALLLGYFDAEGAFRYAGHTGGGFDRAGLQAMYERLIPLERATPPFAAAPRTNQRAHWVAPRVVVEVKFAEWTADGRLRQPIFVGVRDDKEARAVTRETLSMQEWRMPTKPAAAKRAAKKTAAKHRAAKTTAAKKPAANKRASARRRTAEPDDVIAQLDAIESDGGDGELLFEAGKSLQISSLQKPYFAEEGITKGDVMRYYARVAPLMLPHLQDRPLALTRYPEGIDGHSFYQQNAPKGTPGVVRVEELAIKGGDDAERIIGGDLATLLYLVQMGALVIHTWFSRVNSLDEPDLSLIDLDPGEGVEFGTVVLMAREVRRITDSLGLESVVKTSGSRGMHIGIPLPRGIDYETSAALAKRVADVVVRNMPEVATLERLKARRPRGSILVDVNQNARGKTMVAPYTLRAQPRATVSAPLSWTEVGSRLSMERFTVRTMPRRAASKGDPWDGALRSRNTARRIAAALESRVE